MFRKKSQAAHPTAIEVLSNSSPTVMDVSQRIAMTVSCHDTDSLPRVSNAGRVITKDGHKLQIMHNGLKVLADGYYGDLIQPIIKQLKGHHEPQEEKVFDAILKRIDNPRPAMIELGSFWAYYSMWFKHSFKQGVAVCCEPDPQNLEIGRDNMKLNGFKEGSSLVFHQSLAGSEDGKQVEFQLDSDKNKVLKLPIYTVDGLCQRHSIKNIDILHIDVQGSELEALKGASGVIKSGKLRFVVVSTHHYVFSGSTTTHTDCKKYIEENGGHIIASHNVIESFSGDGLIVASFDKRDKDFIVKISANTGPSLFRAYEEDLAVLVKAYDEINGQ